MRTIPYTFVFAAIAALCVLSAFFWFASTPAVPNTGAAPRLFVYTFNTPGTLYEAGSLKESTSPYWWVNSGAQMRIQDGVGQTAVGELAENERFRTLYARMNPLDTDLGFHPQNTFRLLSKDRWDNVRLETQFRILNDNETQSPNRNASNGLLHMARYVDSSTLYYAGIRVDGTAVIKKKYHGVYYTMAQKKVFDGEYAAGANLLPHNEWIGLRTEVLTERDGSVAIVLYQKRGGGSWMRILEATDTGQHGNTPPIRGTYAVGIRTDFMDVQFENFIAQTIAG